MERAAAMLSILASTAVSIGAPAFTLPAFIEIPGGGWDQVFDVHVGAEGPGEVQGLNFYLGVSAPLEILSLQLDGAGTMFGANTTGAFTATYSNGGSPIPQIALGTVTTATGTVSASGSPVAIASIRVPAGTPLGVYRLTTDLSDLYPGIKSDWAGIAAAAQASAQIIHSRARLWAASAGGPAAAAASPALIRPETLRVVKIRRDEPDGSPVLPRSLIPALPVSTLPVPPLAEIRPFW